MLNIKSNNQHFTQLKKKEVLFITLCNLFLTRKNKRLLIFCDKAQTSKRLFSNRAFSTTSKESLVNWRGADAHRVPESKIPKEAAELHVYLK